MRHALLPPNGGALTDAGTQGLRQALADADFPWWVPEITARKYPPHEYGDWRDWAAPLDPQGSFTNQYGLLANTALITVGLVAFDFDIDQAADVVSAMALLREHLGEAICVRSRPNSPRRAALYRTDDTEGLYAFLKGSDGAIEVFSGRYCKLSSFGAHTDKLTKVKTRLEWAAVPGNVRRADLTAVTLAQCGVYLSAVRDVLGEAASDRRRVPRQAPEHPTGNLLADDIEELCTAMTYLPNTGPCDWDYWNTIGMALFAGSDGDELALAMFYAWSKKNPASRNRDCISRWRNYAASPPTRIGARSIFKLAIANGYRGHSTALPAIGQPTRQERRAINSLATFKPKEL